MKRADKVTVLVIDDDPELLQLLKLLLETEGYRVRSALNGAEGLRELEHGMPDLILLDMKMPMMNGWEFIRRFREEHGRAAPIVVITASANVRNIADDVEAEDFVGKPFAVTKLKAKVKKHTGGEARE